MTDEKALFSAKVIVACHIGIVLILIWSALSGCSTAPPKRPPTTKAERIEQLQRYFDGLDYGTVWEQK